MTMTAVFAPSAPATLMVGVFENQAVAFAKRLGKAAFAADMPRDPAASPEVVAALGGLPETDPLVVRVFAAYVEGYDAAA